MHICVYWFELVSQLSDVANGPLVTPSTCIYLQVIFLQDTVRKECEERFELTEKLSEAKGELLQLKKPSGENKGLYIQHTSSQICTNDYDEIPFPGLIVISTMICIAPSNHHL